MSCHCSMWRKPKMLKKSSSRGSGKRVFDDPNPKAVFDLQQNHLKICCYTVVLYGNFHGLSSSSRRRELHSGQTASPGRVFTFHVLQYRGNTRKNQICGYKYVMTVHGCNEYIDPVRPRKTPYWT